MKFTCQCLAVKFPGPQPVLQGSVFIVPGAWFLPGPSGAARAGRAREPETSRVCPAWEKLADPDERLPALNSDTLASVSRALML